MIKENSNLFAYRKYWPIKMLPAPVLPMSRAEMDELGWDSCDIIIISGDAYVDHPSFGVGLIGRLLENFGYRVGIIAQPDWNDPKSVSVLGKPNLFFGITAGNMDSMVNKYTADKKIRSDDAYTPGGVGGKRPDRATLVYSQLCRRFSYDTPLVLGGIEASLRRTVHHDYWSEKYRKPILLDAKADILLYGNAERALIEFTWRLTQQKNSAKDFRGIRGSAWVLPANEFAAWQTSLEQNGIRWSMLPDYQEILSKPHLYIEMTQMIYRESNPYNAKVLVQKVADRFLVIEPPAIPLTTEEMDKIYALPFTRKPHPLYSKSSIPAWEMIKDSITIMRGCFGGCSFCSITLHEGRIVQNRSNQSITEEIKSISEKTNFSGQISDLGGPTANMYTLGCDSVLKQASCRKLSCIYPKICPHLRTDHSSLIDLYRSVRALPMVKKAVVSSGVRYDLALQDKKYIKELVTHHVGGYLKVAPEHVSDKAMKYMMKPEMEYYERFQDLFDRFSQEAGKEQYLIPYFIAAHPGTEVLDMVYLTLWLKKNNIRPRQVQTFLPTPLTLASAMYATDIVPSFMRDKKFSNRNVTDWQRGKEKIFTAKTGSERQLFKAFLQYYKPENWPVLRAGLRKHNLSQFIGSGSQFVVSLENFRDKPLTKIVKGENKSSYGKRSKIPQKKNTVKKNNDRKN